MRTSSHFLALTGMLVSHALFAAACSDDDGTEADRYGVGAECDSNDDCRDEGQSCLLAFKGGYCGSTGCTADEDCPDGSGCVTLEGTNYCFLECIDKPECNRNRTLENESNCSSSVDFIDDMGSRKACVPPSGS